MKFTLKNALGLLGEENPLNLFPESGKTGNVRIHSLSAGLFVETQALLSLPEWALEGLSLILHPSSPIPVECNPTGWYHKLFQVAWVHNGDRPSEEIERSVLHESGHHIWSKLLPQAQRQFAYATRKCHGGPNDWRNPEERFADAIAIAVQGATTKFEAKVANHAIQALR